MTVYMLRSSTILLLGGLCLVSSSCGSSTSQVDIEKRARAAARERFHEKIVAYFMPALLADRSQLEMVWNQGQYSADRKAYVLGRMCYRYPSDVTEDEYRFLEFEYGAAYDKITVEKCVKGKGILVDGRHTVVSEDVVVPSGTRVALSEVMGEDCEPVAVVEFKRVHNSERD